MLFKTNIISRKKKKKLNYVLRCLKVKIKRKINKYSYLINTRERLDKNKKKEFFKDILIT